MKKTTAIPLSRDRCKYVPYRGDNNNAWCCDWDIERPNQVQRSLRRRLGDGWLRGVRPLVANGLCAQNKLTRRSTSFSFFLDPSTFPSLPCSRRTRRGPKLKKEQPVVERPCSYLCTFSFSFSPSQRADRSTCVICWVTLKERTQRTQLSSIVPLRLICLYTKYLWANFPIISPCVRLF